MLDYEQMLFLDAENLAEEGMAEAYSQVIDKLSTYGITLKPIVELCDHDAGTYSVSSQGREYCIYKDMNDIDSWNNATVAFFAIVNEQLADEAIKLYALNSANDLGGIVLTQVEFQSACQTLESKRDWPYLPKHGDDWLGQPH